MAANTQAVRAGRAFVELFVNDQALVGGLRKAETKLKAMGAASSRVGRTLLAAAAIAGAPLAKAVATYAGFDDQMRAVAGVTAAGADEMAAMTAVARRLGATMSFTAGQVAETMANLGRAGFRPDEIIAATESMLDLARATGTDTATAADIAGATLRAFRLEAADATQVADILAATANGSAQTLVDLGEAMKYVAPIAASAGEDLLATSAALALLANNGIKGSLAGNALGRAYKNLATQKVQDQLAAIGVAVADANGNLRPVAGIIEEIGAATAGMGSAERLALLENVFGRGSVAADILSQAGAFDKMSGSLQNYQGAAKRTATMMDSGLGGSFRRMLSSVEGLQLSIGEALAPVISALADRLGAISARVMELVDKNRDLVVGWAKIVAIVAAVGGGLLALGGVLSLLAVPFGVLATLAGAVVSILGAVFSVGGAVTLALVALAGVAIDLAGGFATLRADGEAAFNGIRDALAAGDIGAAMKVAMALVKLEFARAVGWLQTQWASLAAYFHSAQEAVANALVVGWIETSAAVSQAWGAFVAFFARSWERIKGWAQKAWNFIRSLFEDGFDLDAANRLVDQQVDLHIAQITTDRADASAAAEAERQFSRQQAANLGRQEIDSIGAAISDRETAAAASVAAARDELSASLAAAAAARAAAAQAAVQETADRADRQTEVAAAAAAGGRLQSAAAAGSAAGAFSSFALRGLGAQGGALDKIARATEQTARNTENLRDADSLAFA
jgi:TP901 family phage tail tape measure protein